MVPLKQLSLLFVTLFLLGGALTFPLYKFDWHKFSHSSVFIKILFWAPIFAVFILLLYAGGRERATFLATILLICLWEISRPAIERPILWIYWLGFAGALSHLVLIGIDYPKRMVGILITLCLATVLADVAAFFAGNYIGKHNLPRVLNPNKSWEGVAGELVGASLGVLLVNVFVQPVINKWIFIPIGIGAIIGDISNSYFKRDAGVKDWSAAIPGHGGFTDRLSSLAGSSLLVYWFLKLLN